MSQTDIQSSSSTTAKLSKRKQRAAQFREAVKKGESFSHNNQANKAYSDGEYAVLKVAREAKKQEKIREREQRAKEIEAGGDIAGNKKKQGTAVVAGKKRKVEDHDEKEDGDDDVQKKQPVTKRQKKAKGEKKQPGGPRFILFIGNLLYSTTQDALQTHLVASKPDVIRIPTDKITQKPKGFAFAEFMGQDASKRMKICLRLHHTELEGRKINVELTAGGGGSKSTSRKQKLKEKNEKLETERREFQAAKAVKEKAKVAASDSGEQSKDTSFVHPSRLARVQ
ncbi:hypothetical protein V1509DRAFT_627829 [Lipomyces kononenkoae]